MHSITAIRTALLILLLFHTHTRSISSLLGGPGDRCNPINRPCRPKLFCVGPPQKKRCRRPSGPGGPCGRPGRRPCASGLTCDAGVCVIVVAAGDDCEPEFTVCATGFVCDGAAGARTCKTVVPQGGACGAVDVVCESGLDCEGGVCVNIVAVGGDCSADGSVCVDGSTCLGETGAETCKMLSSGGGACGNASAACEAGLECDQGVCKTVVPQGGSCDGDDVVCADGLTCAGTVTDMRCVSPMALGEACEQDPYWVCAESLTCIQNICT